MRRVTLRAVVLVKGAVLVGLIAVVVVAGILAATVPAAAAQAGGSADDEAVAVQELVNRYSPIMMLKSQDKPCDTYGESFVPMSVDAVLGNDQIALRQVGNGDPTVVRGPSAADLFGLGGGFYLDFPGDSLQPGCLYEKDFRRYTEGEVATIYAHIAQQIDEPDKLALQYWIYWYYNDWNNKHESDWEFIQLVFPVSTVDDALRVEPESVGYAQHEGGERAGWQSAKLEREGTHPVVYSSVGSHASYYGSALFLGRSGSEGFGCDNTDGPSTRVRPQVVVLPDVVTAATEEFAWLAFEGRWGERHDGPFNGPDGPYRKPRWTKPIDWQDGLRSGSVIVPTGDAQAQQLVGAFCSVVEFGSVQVILLQTSPTRLVITLALLVLVVSFLVNRTSWDRVEPLPIVSRRRSGQIARATFDLYRRDVRLFAPLGLLYLPLAALAGLIAGLLRLVPFADDILSTAEDTTDAARVGLSLAVGSFASLLAFVVVSAAVSTAVGELSRGETTTPLHAFRAAVSRIGDLARGLLLGTVIVVLLELTVIGIPFGIHRLVRFQLLTPVVMVEGLGGRAALRRSSELVRGRWLNTAIMVIAIYGAVALIGSAVGLVMLLLFTSIPLWLLSTIVTLVSAMLLPLGAIALMLLYGDAAAENAAKAQLAAEARAGEKTTGIDSGPEMKLDAR